MRLRLVKIASAVALTFLFSSTAWADRCKFSSEKDPHETDDPDPRGLNCSKCKEIADAIAKSDPNVWTLDIKYGKPKRVEVKRETGNPEVYWYVYYELTNNDKLERPCFIDVTAESDKGKNTYTYHDCIVPEVKAELRRVVGVKDGETLYTSEELCLTDGKNKLPSKDLPEKVHRDQASGIYEGANAKLSFPMIKPGETRKCVAMFQKLDTEFDFLTIYFHGLTNTTTSIPTTPDKPDALNPEASPVAAASEGEVRLVNDPKMQEPEANKRKVVERIFAIEFSCLGDEFAKAARPIVTNEEQLLRPKNLEKDEAAPPKYHDVGIFGTEIVEPADSTLEGKRVNPYTLLGRKWIQAEKWIKSDLR
jgi:hypothetical protein